MFGFGLELEQSMKRIHTDGHLEYWRFVWIDIPQYQYRVYFFQLPFACGVTCTYVYAVIECSISHFTPNNKLINMYSEICHTVSNDRGKMDQ